MNQRYEDAALIAASNLICEYAESHLPAGWELRHTSTNEESCLSLIDPEGNDVEYHGDRCHIRDACEHATNAAQFERRRDEEEYTGPVCKKCNSRCTEFNATNILGKWLCDSCAAAAEHEWDRKREDRELPGE